MSIVCADTYKNLNIEVHNDSMAISPCCLTPTKIINELDFINDEYLKSFREKFNTGEFPNSCHQCKHQEDRGQISRRQASNQWYQDHKKLDKNLDLIRLDYWTGDLCNLRCVICGPKNSSSWKEELNIPKQDKTVNKFWNKLDLSKLEYIHFNGGEPLLAKEHVNLLKAIPNKSTVHLNYNTNGTVLPTKKLLDIWGEFKLVQIDFSIDDVESRFEYQRYPASWTNVMDNLKWFIDNSPANCMFATNTTVSALNYSNLDNVKSWLQKNFSTNRVSDPIEHRTQPAVGLFAVETIRENKSNILQFLEACDQRRNTSWRQTFPELIELITAK